MKARVIELEGVSHSYSDFPVLKNIGFTLEKGDITGFLGPNGAGKTTTFRILTGLLRPLEGRVSIFGMDPFKELSAINAKTGYLPEHPPIYPEMRIREYLDFVMDIRDIPLSKRKSALGSALEKTGLEDRKDQIISTLSKGYRQRVGLAQAIIHDPELLLLDEPAGGLDPVQTLDLIRRIREMAGDYTVLFSSHDLFMASRICKNYIMLFNGVIRGRGSSDELALKAGLGWNYIFEFIPSGPDQTQESLKAGLAAYLEKNTSKGSENTFSIDMKKLSHNSSGDIHPWVMAVSSSRDVRPGTVRYLVDKGCAVLGVKKEEIMVERIFEKLFMQDSSDMLDDSPLGTGGME